jgi:hypothetical protein
MYYFTQKLEVTTFLWPQRGCYAADATFIGGEEDTITSHLLAQQLPISKNYPSGIRTTGPVAGNVGAGRGIFGLKARSSESDIPAPGW